MHRRIRDGLPISVEYLVEQLHVYLDQFVQAPPYHLVSSSLGGKVAIEFALKYPQLVSRLVLICPSGMGDEEQLPIMDGVKARDPRDYKTLITSVFHKPRHVDREMLRYYQKQFQSRKWKIGLIKTVKGTGDHIVRPKLPLVDKATLFISSEFDRIVCPEVGRQAASEISARPLYFDSQLR